MIEEVAALESSGQVGAAMERARQALELAQSIGDPDCIANAIIPLGDLYYRLGRFDEV